MKPETFVTGDLENGRLSLAVGQRVRFRYGKIHKRGVIVHVNAESGRVRISETWRCCHE